MILPVIMNGAVHSATIGFSYYWCTLQHCFCCVSGKLYRSGQGTVESVEERHRHRYEINPLHVEELEKAGFKFVGHSTDNTRMEIAELPGGWVGGWSRLVGVGGAN